MSPLGSVVVELSANIARFESDMGKAARIAQARLAEIGRAVGFLKNSFIGIGVGLGAGLGFESIREKFAGAIESAGQLADLSEATGAAVEGLSALAGAARLSGTSVDDLAGGLQKLNKATVDAQNGGEKTSEAFKAIGISVKDLKSLSPDEVFRLLADRLALYADGAEKTVVAQTLLGKAGANLLPVLNDLAEVGNYQVRVTSVQAQMADELEKNQVRLKASTDALFKTVGLELVPAMNVFVKTLLESNNEVDGLRGTVNTLAKDGSIASWAEGAISVVAKVVDGFQYLGREVEALWLMLAAGTNTGGKALAGDFEGARKVIAQLNADLGEIDKRPLFSQRLEKNLADQKAAAAVPPAPPRPRIDASKLGNANKLSGFGALNDNPGKKILEGQLKEQEDLIAREKSTLQTRQQMVDFYRGLEYFTLRDSEDKRQGILKDSLALTQADYDRELAALDRFVTETQAKQRMLAGKTLPLDGGTQSSSDPKVNKLQNELRVLETQKQEAINRRSETAFKKTNDEIDVNAQLVQSQLRLLEVRRKFDLETTQRSRVDEISNASAQFQIDLLGRDTLEVQKLSAARQVQLDLDERIYRLKKLDPTASAEIAAAQAQAAQQVLASNTLIEASYLKQRDASFGAAEAIRKYREDAANAAAQIESALTNAFKGAEDALVSLFTKGDFSIQGLKASFKGLADSVVADITRMIVKQSITAPLAGMLGLSGAIAGGATGSGAGGFLSSLITTGFAALTGTANPNIGPPIPGRAAGGPVSAGGLYRVNELNRPEILDVSGKQYLMMGDRNGTVIPNNLKSGGREYLTMGRDGANSGPASVSNNATSILNVHVTPPAGSSRETAMQWGAIAGRQIQHATRRNG